MRWRDDQGHAIVEHGGAVLDLTERKVLAIADPTKLENVQRKLAKRFPEPAIEIVDSPGTPYDILASSLGR